MPAATSNNAPMIAYDVDAATLDRFCDGAADHSIVHDKVVSVCPSRGTATLELTAGFSFARPLLYLSTDANHPAAGDPRRRYLCARSRKHPCRRRRQPVLAGGADIRHDQRSDRPRQSAAPGLEQRAVRRTDTAERAGRHPDHRDADYSPLWDINPGVWTQAAIERGVRTRVTEEFQILGLVEKGWITGLGGGTFGSVGFVVNCPVVFRFL